MAVTLVIAPLKANAQSDSLPGFSVPKNNSGAPPMPLANLDPQLFSNYETAFLKLRNKTLSDTLILQYQISLLKILIKRQAEIDNISTSFSNLNVKFNQPAPEKTICERLPENLLCMLFYPALFDIDVEAYTNPQPAIDLSKLLPVNNTPSGGTQPSQNPNNPANNKPTAPQEPEEEEIVTSYFWSDIQCAVSACKAVLLDAEHPGRAYTVRSGQKLPDDSIVTEISINGVKVNKKGEVLTVEPAPAEGGLGRPDTGTRRANVIGDILGNAGVSNTASAPNNNAAAPARNEPATTAPESASQGSLFDPAPATTDNEFISTTAPPPVDEPAVLGPTGLF